MNFTSLAVPLEIHEDVSVVARLPPWFRVPDEQLIVEEGAEELIMSALRRYCIRTLRRMHIELLAVRPPGMRIVERNVVASPFVRGLTPPDIKGAHPIGSLLLSRRLIMYLRQ
jgi:hypothetical protein